MQLCCWVGGTIPVQSEINYVLTGDFDAGYVVSLFTIRAL